MGMPALQSAPSWRMDAAPKRPRWKPLPVPHALERAYYATLLEVVERTFVLLRKYAASLPVKEVRQDAEEDEPLVTFEVEEVEAEIVRAFPTASVRKAAERTAEAVDVANLRAMRRQFSETLGINVLEKEPRLRPTVEEFTKRNVALIKSMQGEALEGLRHALVSAGLEKGVRPEVLAKMLEERYGIAKRKAQFIATDQVGKLTASLTEERHKELGITSYRWRTVRDNRVRRRHVKREGVVFDYDNPPADGHAGQAPRCRCYQEPIVPEPVEEKLREETEAPKKAAAAERRAPARMTAKTAPKRARPARITAKQKPAAKKARPARMTAKPARKAPAKRRSAPARAKPVTTAPTPASAAPAVVRPTKGLPRGPIRGTEAEDVMRDYPEVKVLGDLLRVDDFAHPTVRKEVGDLVRLPPGLLERLPEIVTDIHIAARKITDLGRSGYAARLKGVTPRGWTEGRTWDECGGLYSPNSGEVLVAVTHSFSGGETSGALHEIGHAVDSKLKDRVTSETPEFMSAWGKFKNGGYRQSGHPYFNQEAPAGPEETIADAFAVYFKNGKAEAEEEFGPDVVAVIEAEYGPTVFPKKGKKR